MKKNISFFCIVMVVFLTLSSCSSKGNREKASEESKLSSWLGNYFYYEDAPPPDDPDHPRVGWEYSITIFELEKQYYATIRTIGFQRFFRALALVEGDEEMITFTLKESQFNVLRESDEIGSSLLTFTKRNSILQTKWGSLKAMLESNLEEGVYFSESG
ncbi:MAG: DUF5991 domain-containing protein [Firmicutes bacterium]|nr:DUF5991 domain-containing protein [Bacillota bacterium]